MNNDKQSGSGTVAMEPRISTQISDFRWTEDAANLPVRIDYKQTQVTKISFDLLRENRIIAALEPDHFSNAYKILRTQVLHIMRDKGWNTVGVTSPGYGEGKTLTAINLAISLAMDVNQTVLLVDANLRNPSIHDYFGIQRTHGLSDYLCDGKPVEDMLIHPSGIDRLVILAGGSPLMNAGEMLSSHIMVRFLHEVKTRYPSRIVVIDLPPTLVAGEALAIAPYIDATLLVVEAEKTKKEDVTRTEDLLGSANVIGTVLSKSKQPPRRY